MKIKLRKLTIFYSLILIGFVFAYQFFSFPQFLLIGIILSLIFSLIILQLIYRLESFSKNENSSYPIENKISFLEFSKVNQFVQTLIYKNKIIDAVNIALTKSSNSINFFKVASENLGVVFNTPNIYFILYDPTTGLYEKTFSNGNFLDRTFNIDFKFLDQYQKNIIPPELFSTVFKNEDINLQNLGILKLHSSLNYIGYILLGYSNKLMDPDFFSEYNSVLLQVSTSFDLHINHSQLRKKIRELDLLNKIITLMEKDKDLNEIYHLYLTYLTSNDGIGFNRAILFSKNGNFFFGEKAIGEITEEEAKSTWEKIEKCPIEFFYSPSEIIKPINKIVNSSKINYSNDIYLKTILAKQNYETVNLNFSNFSESNKKVFKKFNLENFILVPLISYDTILGFVIVDNKFDKKKYTEYRLNSLINFSHQTALVINNLHLYQKNKKIAIIDELTQLYNRRFFDTSSKNEMTRSIRENIPLSLIMIDIDHFKNYNDNNGHIAGDILLSTISKLFKDTCRETDFVCRYGGEEFSIILPNTDMNGASELAEKVRTKVAENTFPYEELQPLGNLTISLGVSNYPETATTLEELKQQSDEALYSSKHSGRNKVTLWNEKIECDLK
ncbi:sensor domain-containing diguanylate cyclase [Haliovirga abyssi]|uniref:GGDEF domain-containing protein n=1 Tax=Haliovirga abyssi TaxID=2996794 RepID=A0AAU9DPG9_9FUSO|nr:sensor domain-containing diguanylate cyclase [Haliovirga abyssi]BDU50323.1 hypothetical protein HLVA_08920 [Haliovirga abyssi]